MIDLYLCPSCLFIELAEDDLDKCPKCSNPLLFVDADPEFKHLIVDVLNDHGCEVASTVAIILALTYPLYVKVRKDKKSVLDEEELKTILRKHENYAERGIEVLKSVFKPRNVEEFEKQLSSIL
jgi:hypothetical protein